MMRFALTLLALLYALALAADFLSPLRYDASFRENAYHPPQALHWNGDDGVFVYAMDAVDRADKVYRENFEKKIPLRFFVEGYAYALGPFHFKTHLWGGAGGQPVYLMGADSSGRDVLSRLLKASRVSLSIGLLGTLITFVLGLCVGSLAGYFGGLTDRVLMRICDVLLCFPFFYVMLAMRGALPLSLSSVQVYIALIVMMSLVSWPGIARVIRGLVASLKQRDFIVSARISGISTARILFKHIVPNMKNLIVVYASLSVPGYIFGEAALSFLGLGIQEPEPSWGNMLSSALNLRALASFPWLLWAGALITLTVLGFNLLGEALRKHEQLAR